MDGLRHMILFCDAIDRQYENNPPTILLWPVFLRWKEEFAKWLRFV